MISIAQIKAARALLGWKQSDLARATDLSTTTLNYVERSTVSPRTKTIDLIQKAFEAAGIEFLAADGLRRRTEVFDIQTYTGRDAVRYLTEGCLESQKKGEGEPLWFGASEEVLVKDYRRLYFAYFVEMQKLGLTERAICSTQRKGLYAPASITAYREVPRDMLGGVDFGIFGNRFCLTVFGATDRLIVIEHAGTADAFRQQFEAFWTIATPVRAYKSGFERDLAHLGKTIR